MILASRKKI